MKNFTVVEDTYDEHKFAYFFYGDHEKLVSESSLIGDDERMKSASFRHMRRMMMATIVLNLTTNQFVKCRADIKSVVEAYMSSSASLADDIQPVSALKKDVRKKPLKLEAIYHMLNAFQECEPSAYYTIKDVLELVAGYPETVSCRNVMERVYLDWTVLYLTADEITGRLTQLRDLQLMRRNDEDAAFENPTYDSLQAESIQPLVEAAESMLQIFRSQPADAVYSKHEAMGAVRGHGLLNRHYVLVKLLNHTGDYLTTMFTRQYIIDGLERFVKARSLDSLGT
jgi:hypothetical protein